MPNSTRRTERRLLSGIGLWASLLLAAALLLAAGSASAEGPGAQVTAVVGEAVTGSGQPLENRSQIADDEKIAMGQDGACSILIDDDALIEMCEQTAVVLETDQLTGRRRVRLDAGSIRILVEPRVVDERIEVHTPAAIATILGTIVHFAVDPKTGETTITSTQSKVRVESSDPAVKGSTIVSAAEQVAMKPGEAPPAQPRRLEAEEIAELGGCLVDFHDVARNLATEELELNPAERIAAAEAANTPWSGTPGPAAPAPMENPTDDLVDPAEVCSPTDCGMGGMNSESRDTRVLESIDMIQNSFMLERRF
jgi:hypothetical protein